MRNRLVDVETKGLLKSHCLECSGSDWFELLPSYTRSVGMIVLEQVLVILHDLVYSEYRAV